MNVLFVVLSPIEGNTSGVISNIGVINGLLELGHTVEVLTTRAIGNNVVNKNIGFINDSVVISYLESGELYKKVVSSRQDGNSKKKKMISMLRKLYYKLKILDNMVPVAKSVNCKMVSRKQYDLVISASDPKSSHIAVSNLIKTGLLVDKWIQYWGDPLANDITRKSIWPKWIVKLTEKTLLAGADKICYVSPFTLKQQQKEFRKYSDNMFFQPLPYERERYMSTRNDGVVKLGYFGDYNSEVRNIVPLYDACKSFPECFLTIAGGSDLNLEEVPNIKIYPRVPKETIEEMEEDSDILVCVMNKSGSQIPGKIYYAAATNKAVLVVLDGDNIGGLEEYLNGFNRFVLCHNNADSIRNAVNKIKETDTQWQPCKRFSPKNIASQILEEVQMSQ